MGLGIKREYLTIACSINVAYTLIINVLMRSKTSKYLKMD